MLTFLGNTSSEATSPQYNLAMFTLSFSIVNKTAGAIAVNVYVITGGLELSIIPNDLSLGAGEMYEDTKTILINAQDQLKVTTDGEIDYYFTLENTVP